MHIARNMEDIRLLKAGLDGIAHPVEQALAYIRANDYSCLYFFRKFFAYTFKIVFNAKING